MAIGDVYTLHAQWHLTNGFLIAENQFHFKQTVALVFDTPVEDLLDAFITLVEPSYVACVSGQWSIINYRVVAQPSGLTAGEQSIEDHSGLLTGDALPPQIATILSFFSSHPGRRGKGRVFLPPANEANSGAIGTPSSTLIGLVSTLGEALMEVQTDGLLHAGWQWGVWSQADQAFYEALGTTSRFRFKTMKSRAA